MMIFCKIIIIPILLCSTTITVLIQTDSIILEENAYICIHIAKYKCKISPWADIIISLISLITIYIAITAKTYTKIFISCMLNSLGVYSARDIANTRYIINNTFNSKAEIVKYITVEKEWTDTQKKQAVIEYMQEHTEIEQMYPTYIKNIMQQLDRMSIEEIYKELQAIALVAKQENIDIQHTAQNPFTIDFLIDCIIEVFTDPASWFDMLSVTFLLYVRWWLEILTTQRYTKTDIQKFNK